MYLKYLGQRKQLKLEMPFLVSGPYFVDGPGAFFEVDDSDGAVLLARNPHTFSRVKTPKKPEKVTEPEPPVIQEKSDTEVKCGICGKTFINVAGLRRHKTMMHRGVKNGNSS